MSFSNLRGSSLLYILNKEGVPSVNVGTVINVTAPYGKYGNMAMAFGQQPEQVVDLTVKVDDKQGQFFKVPANADVWEYENNGIAHQQTLYVLAHVVGIRLFIRHFEWGKRCVKRVDGFVAKSLDFLGYF